MNPSLPQATYRLQFHKGFTLRDAAALVGYLHELGISHVYASPLTAARPGSLHGYDQIDPTRLNPELGTEEDLAAFAGLLRKKDMGLIVDVVPNHLCIGHPGNLWWMDVLSHGPSSPFAATFDIEWQPPKAELAEKVLLPVLGDQYGTVLEDGQIQVLFEDGAFFFTYFDHRFPAAPKSWSYVLEPCAAALKASLGPSHIHVLELESILNGLRHLPSRSRTDPEGVEERRRESTILRQRLAAIVGSHAVVRDAVQASLRDLNGTRGTPASFDRLDAMLAAQAYRLSDWRVASDEINYRRFFDINDLAAIRVEDPQVFERVHSRVLEWIRRGWVSGLRIDHVDGLYDPARYLSDLQAACAAASGRPPAEFRPFYIVVEKIFGADEGLRPDWPVHGATGYGFLNLVNGLFVDVEAEAALRRFYASLAGSAGAVEEIARTCRKFIMLVSMASEIYMLAWRLDRISEQHRRSRDFTLESLRFALREVVASFSVYRTYVGDGAILEEDRRVVEAAVAEARRVNPATSGSLFDFVAETLLGGGPPGLTSRQMAERRDFIRRFQQVTGPVMAKGVEDTAFYRHVPLVSLNEVGSELGRFGVTVERFHEVNAERAKRWPHALTATMTHDTKRSEDARARIDALSEIPDAWTRAVQEWRERNRPHRGRVGRRDAPDGNEEYLMYQTMVAIWGTGTDPAGRVKQYLIKALREAKLHTSWIRPDEAYERAVTSFLEKALADPGFVSSFEAFLRPVAQAGLRTSLSQTLLKIASPGAPDFYQGTETWTFSLVDPDNRQAVEFGRLRKMMESMRDLEDPRPLLERIEDGRLKLFVTRRGLQFRRRAPEVFSGGAYVPLDVDGERRRHVCAFARRAGAQEAVALAGRFFLQLGDAGWGNTEVRVPGAGDSAYRDAISGHEVRARAGSIALTDAFSRLPVALLERIGG